MKTSLGRPIDLSGINIPEIEDWMKNNRNAKDVIKCQAIISLHNGNSMQDVCNVLSVTRETVRLWKKHLRENGLTGLLIRKKAGKRAKIGIEQQLEIKKIIRQRPTKYGYDEKTWTGQLIVQYVKTKWNIEVGVRTAQLWLKQVR